MAETFFHGTWAGHRAGIMLRGIAPSDAPRNVSRPVGVWVTPSRTVAARFAISRSMARGRDGRCLLLTLTVPTETPRVDMTHINPRVGIVLLRPVPADWITACEEWPARELRAVCWA